MIKKCCANCIYADEGVCEYAGEISSDFVCDKFEDYIMEIGNA